MFHLLTKNDLILSDRKKRTVTDGERDRILRSVDLWVMQWSDSSSPLVPSWCQPPSPADTRKPWDYRSCDTSVEDYRVQLCDGLATVLCTVRQRSTESGKISLSAETESSTESIERDLPGRNVVYAEVLNIRRLLIVAKKVLKIRGVGGKIIGW